MSRLRIAHIITRMDKGGSAQNTLFTAVKLDKHKYDVSLISGNLNDPQGEISRVINESGIKFMLVPNLVREISLFNDIKAFWQLYSVIKKEKFDILHTHTSKAGILGRWAGKLAGVKIIIHTPHGHVFYGYFGRIKTGLFITLERITACITDRIITLTEKGKLEHIAYRIAGEDKFIPIYSGIDVQRFRDFSVDIAKEKVKLGINFDCQVIGTVTRLDPIKGNRYLIAAFKEITVEFPNVKLVIIGNGSELQQLKLQSEQLGIKGDIIFLGTCEDIRPLVSIFDLFVLASLNEGMGRVLLEAQALGVPVVATNVGGIPEVVKDGSTGILVAAGDSALLAQAIIRMLRDKGLRQVMGKQAKSWVDEKFSVDTMVAKIASLYDQLS